jgi:hypothetical protein
MPVPRVHFLYVGLYSVVLGVSAFFMRYIGLQDVGLARFLLNWYGGAGLAAGLLVLTFRVRMKTPAAPMALSRQAWLRLSGGASSSWWRWVPPTGRTCWRPKPLSSRSSWLGRWSGRPSSGSMRSASRIHWRGATKPISPSASPGASSWPSASASSHRGGVQTRLAPCHPPTIMLAPRWGCLSYGSGREAAAEGCESCRAMVYPRPCQSRSPPRRRPPGR